MGLVTVGKQKKGNPFTQTQSRNWRDEGISGWLPDELFSPKFYDISKYKGSGVEKRNETDFFELPVTLKKVISESNRLLDLTDDWDGEGSLGYSQTTLKKAIKFWKKMQEVSFKIRAFG